MTLGLGLEGGPDRVAASEKLVQPEGKDGESARFAATKLRSVEQEPTKDRRALLRIGAGQFGQLYCRTLLILNRRPAVCEASAG